MEWAWQQAGMSASSKLTLLAIAWHVNQNGAGAWPSVKLLAAEADISERSVVAGIKDLEERKLLRVERRVLPSGVRETNVYHLPDFAEVRSQMRKIRHNAETPHAKPAHGPDAKPDANYDTATRKSHMQNLHVNPEVEPGREQNPEVEPGRGARAPKPKIEEAYIESLVAEFGERFGGMENIRKVIERAMIHPALKRTTNPPLRLRHWIEDDLSGRYGGRKTGEMGPVARNGHRPMTSADVANQDWSVEEGYTEAFDAAHPE